MMRGCISRLSVNFLLSIGCLGVAAANEPATIEREVRDSESASPETMALRDVEASAAFVATDAVVERPIECTTA